MGIDHHYDKYYTKWDIQINVLKDPVYNFPCFKILYNNVEELKRVSNICIREEFTPILTPSNELYVIVYDDNFDDTNTISYFLSFLDPKIN